MYRCILLVNCTIQFCTKCLIKNQMACLFCQVGAIQTESLDVWPAGLLKVILWLLHPDPSSRATIKDLQTDKWTTQPVDINDYLFEAVINGKQTLHTKNMIVLLVSGWSHIRKDKTMNESSAGEDMKESGVMNHKSEANNTSNSLATSL